MSTAAARSVCYSCHTPIEGEPVQRLRRGEPVDLHPHCWERIEAAFKYQRERAERDLERQERHIAQRFEADAYAPLCCFPRWDWARFDDVEFRRRASNLIVAAAERWAPEHGSLVLSAPTGAGKTAAMVAWLWRMRDQAIAAVRNGGDAGLYSFAHVSGPELAGARRRAKIGDEAPLVTLACEVRILVLDELGFEPPGEELFVVIDHRYRRGWPTVVTTGLTAEQFQARYGDALYRRLAEGGAVVEEQPE